MPTFQTQINIASLHKNSVSNQRNRVFIFLKQKSLGSNQDFMMVARGGLEPSTRGL